MAGLTLMRPPDGARRFIAQLGISNEHNVAYNIIFTLGELGDFYGLVFAVRLQ